MKLPKVKLSHEVLQKLSIVSETLKQRGSKDHNLSAIIDRIFNENSTAKIIDQFVSDNTPTEYKLTQLLNDPETKEKLLNIAEKKQFGLQSQSGVSDASQPGALSKI